MDYCCYQAYDGGGIVSRLLFLVKVLRPHAMLSVMQISSVCWRKGWSRKVALTDEGGQKCVS